MKAVLLDRDGVLNVDNGYVFNKEDVVWIPGAKEAIAYLTVKDYLVIIITNQSGIARGYYTEEDVKKLHEWMTQEISASGGMITDFFYCPHLREGVVQNYAMDCVCRKPRPGMILQALSRYKIERDDAFLIGDSERDIKAAKRAGISGYLYSGGNLYEFIKDIIEKDI